MPVKPINKSIDAAATEYCDDLRGKVATNPILSNANLLIKGGKPIPEHKFAELSTNTKCARETITRVEELYQSASPAAQEIVRSMVSEVTAAKQCTIEVSPFPLKVQNYVQETYDFAQKKISICPIKFDDPTKLIAPKPNFLEYLMHETAHALDHKASIQNGVQGTAPVETLSYQSVNNAILNVPQAELENRLNCLAALVDSSGNLKRDYLTATNFAQNVHDPSLAYIPTEFLAFSFENTFNSVARGHDAQQFRTATIDRLHGQGYDQATIQWAQDTLRDLSSGFLAALPQNVKQHVEPLYNVMLDPNLPNLVQQRGQPAIQAPAQGAAMQQAQGAQGAGGIGVQQALAGAAPRRNSTAEIRDYEVDALADRFRAALQLEDARGERAQDIPSSPKAVARPSPQAVKEEADRVLRNMQNSQQAHLPQGPAPVNHATTQELRPSVASRGSNGPR